MLYTQDWLIDLLYHGTTEQMTEAFDKMQEALGYAEASKRWQAACNLMDYWAEHPDEE